MAPFHYRCPNTVERSKLGPDDDLTYAQVTCLVCARAHLVTPKTGKLLGAEDE
jgi:hypothetical protein